MDWLGKFLHLPETFLNSSEGPGGGVIQGKVQTFSVFEILIHLNLLMPSFQKSFK